MERTCKMNRMWGSSAPAPSTSSEPTKHPRAARKHIRVDRGMLNGDALHLEQGDTTLTSNVHSIKSYIHTYIHTYNTHAYIHAYRHAYTAQHAAEQKKKKNNVQKYSVFMYVCVEGGCDL